MSASDEELEAIQSSLLSKLTERQLRKMASPNVERIYSRKIVQDAFLETFELIGGVPRLALWANKEENFGDFIQLLMKLAPKETGKELAGQVLEYRSNIPNSPLNRPAVIEQIADGD